MSFGLVVSRCSRDTICARMRSTVRGVEARLGEREAQRVEGLVAVLLERAQGAAEIVAAGAEAELDRLALEPVVEGRGIERAGAFVEQAGRHVGDAGLVGGVLVGAAADGELDRDQLAPPSRCTSQASMPPGLITRSMVMASAAGAASERQSSGVRSAQQAGAVDAKG